MKTPTSSVLVPTVSIITGAIVFLILSGALIQNFNPLTGIVEATKYSSFNYVTNLFPNETSTVSYNMEDLYNSTHLYDFSLNENWGNVSGDIKQTDGFFGSAYEWTSASSGEVICSDLDISSTSFTLEAWIYPTAFGNVYNTIFGVVGENRRFQLNNGNLTYWNQDVVYSNTTINLNEWVHVAAVYDSSASTITLYQNASIVGYESSAHQLNQWDGMSLIGRRTIGSLSREYSGKIDEFRIYKEARTQEEIQNDMESPISHKLILTGLEPNSDIVQLWNTDEEAAPPTMLQETADANGRVQLNVYYFSDVSTFYTADLRVVHSGRVYTLSNMDFAWDDLYDFSLHTVFNEALIATFISALIIIVPSVLFIIHRRIRSRHKTP